MNPEEEKLLEAFEDFEADLEVEEILAKVKEECALDQGVAQFAHQLEEERGRLETGSPGSTSHVRPTTLDPWPLPTVDL